VAVGLLLTAAALGLQAAAPLAAIAVACMVAAVAGHALSQPAMSSLISRAAPPDRQGSTLGANAAAGSLARVCGPVMAGLLYSSTTNNWPILFAAAGMGPAAWLAWRVGRGEALRPG
jgi:MFS family permease